jgi:hypothetical protein
MMDERKLKSAFTKVKGDMSILDDNVAKLQMQVAQSVRDSGSKSNSIDESKLLDKITNLDVELNSVKKLVSALSKLVEHNTNDVKDIKYEFAELKEDLDIDGSGEAANKENIYLVNSKLADFQELINGKLTLEIAELRLEFSEEIAKVFDNMTRGLEKVELNAKVSKDSAKREKILEDDYEILTPNQKTLVEEVEFIEDEKTPSRFKKAIKWLFVDEDEEEDLDSLKRDIKTDEKTTSKKK